jgi:hypothetical protein
LQSTRFENVYRLQIIFTCVPIRGWELDCIVVFRWDVSVTVVPGQFRLRCSSKMCYEPKRSVVTYILCLLKVYLLWSLPSSFLRPRTAPVRDAPYHKKSFGFVTRPIPDVCFAYRVSCILYNRYDAAEQVVINDTTESGHAVA